MAEDKVRARVLGRSLRRVRHLPAFFPELALTREGDAATVLRQPGPASSGLVVEPGLIASVAPLEAGPSPISLVVYPADGAASRLTRLLDEGGWEDDDLLAEAAALRAYKTAERLSRTNSGPPALLPPDERRWVLVIDRTADETFLGARREPDSLYRAMLEAARADNPGARLVVWRRVAKNSSLPALSADDHLIEGEVEVVTLVQRVDRIYTVASLAGLEGVLAGKEVVCFGRPFYAGRGLTEDRSPGPSHRPLCVDALFAAAYLVFPRYVDPLTGKACTPRVALRRLASMSRHARRVRGEWVGLNFSPAKQGVVRAFLSSPVSRYRRGVPADGVRLAAWASRPNRAVEAAYAAGRRVTRVEDGFVRSVGLGSSFHRASSLVLDARGIYYDPGQPSDLEHLLCTETFDAATLAEAADLRARIVALGLSKYNLGGGSLTLPAGAIGRRTILVPGQVENDASVITGGAGMTNLGLLERVRDENRGAFVIYKPHPDVVARQRPGYVPRPRLAELADLVVEDIDIHACIEAVDEVHTLTSLAGFEALLRARSVSCYGWPFYAGWGLTSDKGPSPGPARQPVSLDALVAAALIRYPLYLDPVTWLPCDADAYLTRLAELRASTPAGGREPRFGRMTRFVKAARHVLFPPRPPLY